MFTTIKVNNYKYFSIVLILLSISSFFIGYIYDENSAGGGPTDFTHTWANLHTFLNNSISKGINLTTTYDPEIYTSARTPLIYIFHKLFNPFVGNEIIFRTSVFCLSLLVPFLFYLCLKQKFKKEENLLLILISTTIFLSPFFRTSAYWGNEENFGLITLLLSFLFLDKFLHNNNNQSKDYYLLFLVVFVSSICLYFDQKLAIIPLICFIQIIFSVKSHKLKFFAFFLYFIFSLPYIYLIILWGGLIPPRDALGRGLGNQLFFYHIGYASTIIAFYLLPLLLYKSENLVRLVKNFFSQKRNYYLISIFFIYLFYLLFFHDYEGMRLMGKGFVHKTAILFFEEIIFQKIYIYFSFFFSWIIILVYLSNSLKSKLIMSYFFLLSIIIFPLMQEYFDPLIILMAFTFLNSKFCVNYKRTIFLYCYLSIFLIFSNIYYYNLIN